MSISEYYKKFFMSHVRKEIIDLVKKEKIITRSNIPKRMNSYERKFLMSYWSNELLLEQVEYYIAQSFNEFRQTSKYTIEKSYNDVLKHKLIHILVKRLKELIKEYE